MKKSTIILPLLLVTALSAQDRMPPKESLEACISKQEGTICSFIGPRDEKESGVCEYTPDNQYFACKPERPDDNQRAQRDNQNNQENRRQNTPKYSIEQAISNNAQTNTISFAAMSFMSSQLCEMSFLPPGKHASYFGFQYLRDVVGGKAGHEQNFVPTVANNLLYILTSKQKSILIDLAKKQQEKIEKFALMRFPLLMTFEKYSNNEFPSGTTKLNKEQVINQSKNLYSLDGELSFQRAIGFAKVIESLTKNQKNELNKFKTLEYASWPNKQAQINKRNFNHEVHVAIMTYASELFSWYLGDVKKDTYFTPERTASYFGAYWTKAAPMKAVKRDNYRISTSLTSNSGMQFLDSLNNNHRSKIKNLVKEQKTYLKQMVDIRENISKETRKIFNGERNNLEKIVQLSEKFGELDGEIAYLYANSFSDIKNNLTSSQLKKATDLRNISQYQCKGAFIYAEPTNTPKVYNLEKFFK
jgi:hypothetical protein